MAAAASYDYYEELGVSKTATDQEIKESYRRLAILHHPDKNIEATESATAKFQRIVNAYDTLKDKASRMEYDAGSHDSQAQTKTRDQSGHRWSYQDEDSSDSNDDDGGPLPSAFFYLNMFARFLQEQKRWSEAQGEAQRAAERAEERRRRERERKEALRQEKAQAESQLNQRQSAELVFLERYWARLGAVTADEKIAACLHSEHSEERHQGKKFACGSCGLKKGFYGTECPFCLRIFCGPCSALGDKKRTEAKQADAQGAPPGENGTATHAAEHGEAEQTVGVDDATTETESQKRRRKERQRMEQKKEREREAKEKARREKQEKRDKEKQGKKEREEAARARARARGTKDEQASRPSSKCSVSERTGSSSDADHPTNKQTQADDPVSKSRSPTQLTRSPETTASAQVLKKSGPQPTCDEAKRIFPEELPKSKASTDSSSADGPQSYLQQQTGQARGEKSMEENEKTAPGLSRHDRSARHPTQTIIPQTSPQEQPANLESSFGDSASAVRKHSTKRSTQIPAALGQKNGNGSSSSSQARNHTTQYVGPQIPNNELSSIDQNSHEQGETKRNGQATTADRGKRNLPPRKQKPARNDETRQPKDSTSASQEEAVFVSPTTQHEGQTHDMDRERAEKGAPGGKKRHKMHKAVKKPSTTGPDPGTEGGRHVRCGYLHSGGDSRCFVMHPELRKKRAPDGGSSSSS